ncbi:DUF6482 family protein [Shewanella colwelliana]|uniref:DUF6482 family protein n=1 Tax=Shewanella colwelliana TaxID=23 RepID=UPI0037359D45
MIKMTQQELIERFDAQTLAPTIINTADATHYLVGGEDELDNFYQLTAPNKRPLLYFSLDQAKTQLKQMGLTHAHFELCSAYDEMIGIEPQIADKSSIEIRF